MAGATLQTKLGEMKRRIVAAGAASACGWGLVSAVTVLLAFMWLDLVLEMPPALRVACGAVALIGAAAIAARVLAAAVKSSFTSRLARLLDELATARGQIVSGVDLMRERHAATSENPVTIGLAELAVDRAAELARNVNPRQTVPPRRIWRSYGLLAMVFIALAIVAAISPRLVATQWARFLDPFGDHPPYSRVTFEVEPGDAKVVYGSGVEIRARSQGGIVDRAELVLKATESQGEETLPMFPEDEHTWRATISNVTAPSRYLVRAAAHARSRQFTIDVITVPKLESVTFRVTPPAYTHRPPYDGPLPQGGLSGLPGTRIEARIRSNRPLAGGAMKFVPSGPSTATMPTTAPSSLAMTPLAKGSREVVGAFEIERPGTIHLGVTDTAGQRSVEAFTAPVVVLSDDRPFVRILEPKANSFATPDVTIQIAILAEDDYGISRLQLYRALNDSRTRATEISLPPVVPLTRFPAVVPLRLADYALAPGDVVKLYARVEDNDPAGAKGSESSIVTVRIISQEQLQQMLVARQGIEALQSKYEQAARRLEALDKQVEKLLKELEGLDPNSALAEAKREELNQLSKQIEREADEVAKSAGQDLPLDLDRALRKQLSELAKNMRDAAQDVEKLAKDERQTAGGAAEGLKELRRKLGGQREQFKQEATDPIEHLAKIYPLLEDQARYVTLYEQQRDLAERMASLQSMHGEDDPKLKSRMRDLQEEQARNREELRQLLADIENHAAELPQDARLDDLRKSATAFAAAVRASAAETSMSQAETALAEFAGSRAFAGAKDAADILESFLGKCNGMGEEGQQCLKFQPTLAGALGNTVAQLLGAQGLGSGMGIGAGGGYSARRSTLENVGLYGSAIPTMTSASLSGSGRDARGASTDGTGSANRDSGPFSTDARGKVQASGEAGPEAPEQYRHRVGEYFRRVSEELGD